MSAERSEADKGASAPPESRKALICGISGQDGSYLASLLLKKGYRVIGTSRDAEMNSFRNLEALSIRDRVEVVSMALSDLRSVMQVLSRYHPSEVYSLAGQTSVALSFDQPVEALESIGIGTLNLLEALRVLNIGCRLYNASSGECFGETSTPADERTAFRPRSPYAVAKAAAFWQVATYRDAYGLFACSGLLFNHESPLRPERFVTQKIVRAACRIARGSGEQLRLGNLEIQRDWGWAPEYVEAMWHMLQGDSPTDLVIATGRTNSLADFVAAAFAAVGLDWHDHVRIDQALMRPSELLVSRANPSLAQSRVGWRANSSMPEVVARMVLAEQQRLAEPSFPLGDVS